MSEIVLAKVGPAMVRRVPYDAEVEYLEGTGTQYIDVGMTPNTNTGFFVDFRCASQIATTNERICGSYCGSNGRFTVVARCGSLSPSFYYGWNNASADISDSVINQGNRKTCSLNYLNGRVVTFGTRSATLSGNLNSTQTNNIYLFANNTDSGVSGIFHGRIYSAKVSVEQSDVRDLIPVRVGQVGYMYDRAHPFGGPLGNGLYPNAGTGAFVLGPDKS